MQCVSVLIDSLLCVSASDELKGDYDTMGPDAGLQPVGNGAGACVDSLDIFKESY